MQTILRTPKKKKYNYRSEEGCKLHPKSERENNKRYVQIYVSRLTQTTCLIKSFSFLSGNWTLSKDCFICSIHMVHSEQRSCLPYFPPISSSELALSAWEHFLHCSQGNPCNQKAKISSTRDPWLLGSRWIDEW